MSSALLRHDRPAPAHGVLAHADLRDRLLFAPEEIDVRIQAARGGRARELVVVKILAPQARPGAALEHALAVQLAVRARLGARRVEDLDVAAAGLAQALQDAGRSPRRSV